MTAVWNLQDEKIKFIKHPEYLFIDTTFKRNKGKGPLLLVAKKDGKTKSFIAILV